MFHYVPRLLILRAWKKLICFHGLILLNHLFGKFKEILTMLANNIYKLPMWKCFILWSKFIPLFSKASLAIFIFWKYSFNTSVVTINHYFHKTTRHKNKKKKLTSECENLSQREHTWTTEQHRPAIADNIFIRSCHLSAHRPRGHLLRNVKTKIEFTCLCPNSDHVRPSGRAAHIWRLTYLITWKREK